MGNRYEVSGGVTKHTDLTDKEVNGVIDHANGSVTDAKLLSGVGLNDGQIAKLPVASQGQVLTRGTSAWQAQTPSGGGFNSRVAVHMSADQTVVNGVFGKVQFNIEDFDGNNEYDPTTNYRFTAQNAGYYLIGYRIQVSFASAPNNPVTLHIFKNDSSIQGKTNYINYTLVSLDILALVSLASNDYIEAYIFNGTTTTVTIKSGSAATHLFIHRLS
jgi:hypothetical protein